VVFLVAALPSAPRFPTRRSSDLDGSPAFPDLNVLWRFAQDLRIEHFGTSAGFILACRKAGIRPGHNYDLSVLRSLSSTGSTLPRSEEHTSELQSRENLVCRLLLE